MRFAVWALLLASCDHRAARPAPETRYPVTIDGRDHLLTHARAAFRLDGLELVLSEDPLACGQPKDPLPDDLTGARLELRVPLGFGDFFAGQPFSRHLGACVRGPEQRLAPCDHDYHVVVTMDPTPDVAPGAIVSGTIRRDPLERDDEDARRDRIEGKFVAELCPGRYPGRRLPPFVDEPLDLTIGGRPGAVSQVVLVRPPRGTFHELFFYTDGQDRTCAARRAAAPPERTLILSMMTGLGGGWQPASASFVIRGSQTSGASLTTAAVRFDRSPLDEGPEIGGAVVVREENADMGIPALAANGRFRADVCNYR